MSGCWWWRCRVGSGLPVRAITGHLVWAPDGSVWVCFAVEPFAYPHRSVRDAQEVHARTVGALLALPHRSLILSLSRRVSAGEVQRRILGEVDVASAPGWAGYARRTASAAEVWERMWVLAVQLPATGRTGSWRDRLRAAGSEIAAGFGTPHTPPTQRRVDVASGQAAAVEEELTHHLRLRAVDGGAGEVAVRAGGAPWPGRRPLPHRREAGGWSGCGAAAGPGRGVCGGRPHDGSGAAVALAVPVGGAPGSRHRVSVVSVFGGDAGGVVVPVRVGGVAVASRRPGPVPRRLGPRHRAGGQRGGAAADDAGPPQPHRAAHRTRW